MQSIIIAILCMIILVLLFDRYQTKKQLKAISYVLDDISSGNLDHRLLADENSILSEVIYKINQIVTKDKNRFMEIEKSEKAYKELVTSLSHDIRTPLASLIGYLEVLEEGSVSKEEQDKFMQVAKAKALRLSEYINALFELLKLESGECVYHFEEKDICELTRIVLADWVYRFEKSKIQFQFHIPEKSINIPVDKNLFERIINNIIANSVKHSQADYLEVALHVTNTKVRIDISDNGIGISDQDIPFIFDRLYKCDNARTENSNGLGLAITKELVQIANGSVTVASKVNTGTTFTIQFPRNMKKESFRQGFGKVNLI